MQLFTAFTLHKNHKQKKLIDISGALKSCLHKRNANKREASAVVSAQPKSSALSTEKNYAESHKQTNFFSMHKFDLK